MRKVIQAVELGCADCPKNTGLCKGKNCIKRFKAVPIKMSDKNVIIAFVVVMLLVVIGIPLNDYLSKNRREREAQRRYLEIESAVREGFNRVCDRVDRELEAGQSDAWRRLWE